MEFCVFGEFNGFNELMQEMNQLTKLLTHELTKLAVWCTIIAMKRKELRTIREGSVKYEFEVNKTGAEEDQFCPGRKIVGCCLSETVG
jgi:hypothetical protein